MQRRAFLASGALAGLSGLVRPPTLGAVAPTPRRGADGTVRLSSNENPLGISPRAQRAILDGLDRANRYPTASKLPVVEALAAAHGVAPNNIVLGNGSTEVLQMLVQLLARNGRIVVADPTFEDVPRYAEPFGIAVDAVPLRSDYGHDVDRMREVALGARGPVVVYLCNPNNPTGTLTPSTEIDAWVEEAPERIVFVVDEAYFEYAEAAPHYHTALPWVHRKPNVVVVRTFSKIHGMAGLRLGYGIGHAATIGRIGSIAGHNNANHLACVAARASLDDADFVRRSRETNARAQQVVEAALDDLGIERLPSHTNFLMHRIPGDIRVYIERMRDHGWRVGRPFPPMTAYNRVSFALPDDMMRFAGTLRGFRQRGWV